MRSRVIEIDERAFRRIVIGATVVGAAIRIAMLLTKWDQRLLLNDSFWYSGMAQGLAKGQWFEGFFDVSGAEHAPLTPLVLAPASFLPRPEFWQRATMTIVGIAALPLIAVAGRKLAGRAVGAIAVGIAAVYPNVWMSDSLVMSETLAMALVSLAVIVGLRHRELVSTSSAVVAGVVVGVAALARSELLVLAPVLALIGVRTLPRRVWMARAGALVGGTMLTILPWVAFNLSRFEEPVFMSTNDGTTLLGANCPQTYGGPGLGGWKVICVDAVREGEDPSQRSARQRSAAFDFAKENPKRLPIVVGARVLRSLDLYRLDDQIIGDRGEERASWSAWAGVACFWALAPLAVVGWRRRPAGTAAILGGPLLCVALTSVFFYGAHRLRAPAEPVIVLLASIAIAALLPARQPRRMRTSTRSATSASDSSASRVASECRFWLNPSSEISPFHPLPRIVSANAAT